MISASQPFGGVLRFYVTQLRRTLASPAKRTTWLVAVAMHALGHALVALVTGGITVALVRMWQVRDLRSSPLGGGRSLADEAFLLSTLGLAVLLVKGAAGAYATYVQGRVAGEVACGLRLALLDSLLAVHRLRRVGRGDQGAARSCTPAGGVSALTDRVQDVEVGLKNGLLGGVRAIAQLLPLGVVLFVLSPRMAALAVAVLAVFGTLLGRARATYQGATARGARERERLLEAADESVRHADLWVSYGAEAKARARVRQLGDVLAHTAARLEARAAALSGANEVLGAAALLGAIAASRAGWLGSVAGGETLLAFAVAFFMTYRPLRELADARLALARAEGAYAELAVAVNPQRDPEPAAPEGGTSDAATWSSAALELRELRLARGRCGPLSLRVEPGAVVAIAGPTGIGKTTLLRTLLGLEAPAGGDVVYAGRSLGDAPAGPSARPFAWVPQEAPLLADTLDENVALGARDAVVREALEPIGASRLLAELGAARLGSGGRAVSGGERQWIALARAIATRQPVLLLDEPTSGLDADAQRAVLAAIHRLRGHRTVLMVTHRPEPLEVADVVVRLEAA